jgi:ABC-type amino acid transport substrate-binding protein/nitrogen-specific signal transduction histidine kinase
MKNKLLILIFFLFANVLLGSEVELGSEEKVELRSKWIDKNATTKESKPTLFLVEKKHEKISLNKTEKEYLKNHPIINVSNELDYPPYDYAVEGIAQGYSIDLINLLAKHIGIDIKYINGYTWNELVDMFKRGEIDMLHTLNRTPYRETLGYFSKSVQRYKTYIFTNKNNDNIKNINQLYGKTVVTAEDWSEQKYLQKNHPQINILLVKNLEEMLLAVSQGKADALISNKSSVQYFIKYNNISNISEGSWLKEFDNGKFRHNYFLGQKNSPELMAMFNKAMLLVDKEDIAKLKAKWFGETKHNVILNHEEQLYLAKKDKLLMCVDPKWMPYEAINDKGELTGMSSEYMKIFSGRINKEIVVYPTPRWQESLLSIKSKKCDFISLVKKTTGRKKYLNFSPFYMTFPFVIATKNDKPFIDNLELIKDKTFAIAKGFAIIEDLQQRYENIKILEVTDAKDGLTKVSDGEVFAYLDASAVITRIIQKSGIINVKINGKLPFNSELAIGTHRDEKILAEIFKKVVESLSKEEKKLIHDKWIAVNYEKDFDYTLLWQITIMFSIFFLIGLFFTFMLRKTNKKLKKTQEQNTNLNNELHELNQSLESRVKKEIEKNLKQQKVLSQQSRLAEMGEMLSSIAHQWRQPLNRINANVSALRSVLRRDPIDHERLISETEMIEQNTKYMSDTIGDFSNFFHPDKIKTTFSVQNVISKALELIDQRTKNVKVNIISDKKMELFSFEKEYLQVVVILLNNAIDNFESKSIKEPKIDIIIKEHEGMATLVICDNGGGVDEGDKNRIFDPYYTTKFANEGTGLGLYVAKMLIENSMHGKLQVENKNDGACFKIITSLKER